MQEDISVGKEITSLEIALIAKDIKYIADILSNDQYNDRRNYRYVNLLQRHCEKLIEIYESRDRKHNLR
ncbi:MAG: hypothetical protein H7A23_26935 [Leptospiraceae bacterium]|nr:hypothetical protein [Leptospiraceae bacterium]MCP5498207.1 hypothetical protein [Leptospiraceae bacterium]